MVAGRHGHGSKVSQSLLFSEPFDTYAAYQSVRRAGRRSWPSARILGGQTARPWNHMGMGTWAARAVGVGDLRPAGSGRAPCATCEGGSCQLESPGEAGCGQPEGGAEKRILGQCFHRSRREICRLPSSAVVSVPGRPLGAVDWSRECATVLYARFLFWCTLLTVDCWDLGGPSRSNEVEQ